MILTGPLEVQCVPRSAWLLRTRLQGLGETTKKLMTRCDGVTVASFGANTKPTARTQLLSSTWNLPPMMKGSAWEVSLWPIVMCICQFLWVGPAPVHFNREREAKPRLEQCRCDGERAGAPYTARCACHQHLQSVLTDRATAPLQP